MDKWIELLCNGGGIATGVIAGIVAAFVQFLISHFEHRFLQKAKKEEQIYSFNVWKRDEIGELIKDVSEIKIPAVTETNGDVIENAYHLIMAYFERAKPLLYKKSDPVTIRGFFNTLNIRYRQMQEIKLGYEKGLNLGDAKRVLIPYRGNQRMQKTATNRITRQRKRDYVTIDTGQIKTTFVGMTDH